MSLLLKGTAFDDFCFRQGEISAFTHITIDGRRNKAYYDETQTEDWCSWAEIKPLVFQAVKGKKTPKSMKLILSRPNAEITGPQLHIPYQWHGIHPRKSQADQRQ